MKIIARIFAGGSIFSLITANALHAQVNATPMIREKLHVKAILKEDSPIYRSASTSSEAVEKVEQFSFLFVFEPSVAASDFYYVGKEPRRALGWIPQSRVTLWDHRECIKFTPLYDRLPAKVYANFEDLKASLTLGPMTRAQGLAEEPDGISNRQFAMLLPVLSRRIAGAGNGALEIAYVSANLPQQMVNANAGTNHSANSPAMNYLDILFVLDTTISMSPYIAPTKEILDRITQKVIGMREGGVRVGLLSYRDKGDAEFVTNWYSLMTANLKDVQTILREQVRVGAGNLDVSEAMFDGLYTGITETNWFKGSGLRVIILVGDASGHPVGHVNNPHRYTLDKMIETAAANSVRIISLKIVSKFADDNKIHEEQLQKLAEGRTSGDRGSYLQVNISDTMEQNYVEQVASSVETEIARLLRLIDVTQKRMPVSTLGRGDRAIILKNISRSASSAEPQFSTGWLSEKNVENKLQVKPYVFMGREEMVLILFYMNLALTSVTTPTQKVFDSIAPVVQAQTGEQLLPGQTVQDHYEKRLGLPLRSRMLAFTLEEISSWSEIRRAELVEYINKQKKLLETHNGDPSLWFTTSVGFTYTFVPLDYFP